MGFNEFEQFVRDAAPDGFSRFPYCGTLPRSCQRAASIETRPAMHGAETGPRGGRP